MPFALSATQSAPTCSEHELIAAVRRGDDRSFEILYSRYQRRIVSYINGMVGDHARAEDITQDVFISVLRRLRANDRPIIFKPWLYEVAKNACIDEFRRVRRGQEVPLERDDDLIGANPRLASRAPTPETAIESKQKLAHLRAAFRGLSENHHKLIVMRELEGLSYSQIGEQLGMSQTVVESALFRARRRLGEEYEDLVSGRRCERVQTVIEEGDSRAVRSLGIKERRLIGRHLSHCQACRRHAKLAGVDESLFEQPGLVGKIASLLPIPAWLRLRRGSASAAPSPSHSISLIQSAQGLAAANPAAVGGIGRAAAAVTLIIAGAGTGIVGLGSLPGSSAGAPTRVAHRVVATESSAAHAPAVAARIFDQRRRAAVPRAVNRTPTAAGDRAPATSRLAAGQTASPAAPSAGGRRAGTSGSGSSTSAGSTATAKGSGGAGGGGALHGAPTVTIPSGIKLPKTLTIAVPGLVGVSIPSPGNAGSLSVNVGGSGSGSGSGSGRGGTAASAPGPIRVTLEALGAGVSASIGP